MGTNGALFECPKPSVRTVCGERVGMYFCCFPISSKVDGYGHYVSSEKGRVGTEISRWRVVDHDFPTRDFYTTRGNGLTA